MDEAFGVIESLPPTPTAKRCRIVATEEAFAIPEQVNYFRIKVREPLVPIGSHR